MGGCQEIIQVFDWGRAFLGRNIQAKSPRKLWDSAEIDVFMCLDGPPVFSNQIGLLIANS